MKQYFPVALVLAFIIGLETSDARRSIFCYVCDSYYEPECAAPFDNRTFSLAICPPGHHECSVTLLQNDSDDFEATRYIRECAMNGKVGSKTSCLMAETGNHHDMTCYCDKDGCNQNHEFQPV